MLTFILAGDEAGDVSFNIEKGCAGTCSSVRFLESFVSQIWVDEPSSQHMFKF
jgi:hypothetical protein